VGTQVSESHRVEAVNSTKGEKKDHEKIGFDIHDGHGTGSYVEQLWVLSALLFRRKFW
jgi:hypothetical protein